MYTFIIRDVDAFGVYEDVFEYETFEDVLGAYKEYGDSEYNPLARLEDANSTERFVWCEGKYRHEQPKDEFAEMFIIDYVDRVSGECVEEEASSYSGLKEIARTKASSETMVVIRIVDSDGYEYKNDYNSWEEM